MGYGRLNGADQPSGGQTDVVGSWTEAKAPLGPATVAHFGPFQLDAATCELSRAGHPLRLRLQAARCLLWLVRHPQQLVLREHLRRDLWRDDAFVNFDQGLNTCVSEIRIALGDDAAAPRYVETLAARGYRFLAPVTWSAPTSARARPVAVEPASAPASTESAPSPVPRRLASPWIVAAALALVALALVLGSRHAAAPPRLRLLVLPFRNLTGDTTRDYVCEGLTEETINRLAGLAPARLAVIARTTAQALVGNPKRVTELARELRVDYVLEGALGIAGQRARVSTRLVRADEEVPIWSGTGDHDLGDLLDLQDASARMVVLGVQNALHLALPSTTMRPPRHVRPEAHDQVLIGRYRLNDVGRPEGGTALAAFDAAIALQPDYPAAHAGRAAALVMQAWGEAPPKAVLPAAAAALERALQLDPDEREAHLARARLRLHYAWDVTGAGREFDALLRQHPGWAEAYHARAAWHSVRGDHAAALRDVRTALDLDPLSRAVNLDAGWYAYLARRPDEARQGYERTLQLEPGFSGVHLLVLLNAWVAGRWSEAMQAAQALVRASGGTPQSLERLMSLPPEQAARRFLAAGLRGLQHSQEQGQYLSEDNFYPRLALLGHTEEALASLERAAQERAYFLIVNVAADPALDSLRAEPRFLALRQRLGLDAER